MTPTWILFVVLYTQSTVTTTVQKFPSEQSCELAKKALQQSVLPEFVSEHDLKLVCVEDKGPKSL